MKHKWVKEIGRTWTICKNCGAILRQDRQNEKKECQGKVLIKTR